MFKEYEVIKSKIALSEMVQKGTVGTILIIYNSFPVEYEIEFVDDDGNSIEILTVKEDKIEKK